MALTFPYKDPDEVLDYSVDWSERVVDGDSISYSTWFFSDDADGLLEIGDMSFEDEATTVWLSAGTLGQTYQLVNRVYTVGGRVMDQTVKLKIKTK